MLQYFKKQDPETLKGKKAVFIACDRLEPYTGYLREKRKSLFQQEDALQSLEIAQVSSTVETIERISLGSDEIIVDMRSYASYEMEHIQGSLNFPFAELKKYLAHDYLPFPKESQIIFVCPFGEESALLADMATRIGYRASSLA